jgi:hypothetical protein
MQYTLVGKLWWGDCGLCRATKQVLFHKKSRLLPQNAPTRHTPVPLGRNNIIQQQVFHPGELAHKPTIIDVRDCRIDRRPKIYPPDAIIPIEQHIPRHDIVMIYTSRVNGAKSVEYGGDQVRPLRQSFGFCRNSDSVGNVF